MGRGKGLCNFFNFSYDRKGLKLTELYFRNHESFFIKGICWIKSFRTSKCFLRKQKIKMILVSKMLCNNLHVHQNSLILIFLIIKYQFSVNITKITNFNKKTVSVSIDTFLFFIGSPYENVRPSSKNARSVTTDPSPGTSPQRWGDFLQRHARPPEAFDDRRVSGVSGISM